MSRDQNLQRNDIKTTQDFQVVPSWPLADFILTKNNNNSNKKLVKKLHGSSSTQAHLIVDIKSEKKRESQMQI
jgi:hypothetical protein